MWQLFLSTCFVSKLAARMAGNGEIRGASRPTGVGRQRPQAMPSSVRAAPRSSSSKGSSTREGEGGFVHGIDFARLMPSPQMGPTSPREFGNGFGLYHSSAVLSERAKRLNP